MMLSVAEVRKELNVHPETIRRMLKDGRLQGTRISNQWRIYPESLHELIRNGEPQPGVIDPHASRSRLVAVEGSLRERERAA